MAETGDGDHDRKVRDAFDSFHSNVSGRLDDDARRSLERLRASAAGRDAAALREGLTGVRETHGWLYEEMARHPGIANLFNELALWGF